MIQKITVLLLVFILGTGADTVYLQSGKKVQGTILAYNSNVGLQVDSEYGIITIKPSNISSFVIDEKTEMVEEEPVTFEKSNLKNRYKLGFDFSLLDVDTTMFDVDYHMLEDILFVADNTSKGAALIVGVEEVGLGNEEYFGIYAEYLKKRFRYTNPSERSKVVYNGVEMYCQKISGEMDGLGYSYMLYTFVHNGVNYRILYWGYTGVFKKVEKSFEPFIKSIELL